MPRYFIHIAYKGTNYHGWQVQGNACTVQGELNRALCTLLHEPIETTGAGRTDTGVHAQNFVAHFDSEKLLKMQNTGFEMHDSLSFIVHKLNGILPADICVYGIRPVAPDAHARFDAIERTYKYYVATRKNPFNMELSAYLPFALDMERMNEAARVLFDYTDFTSFAKLHGQAKTNNCRIVRAAWEATADGMVFTISADRFLRNMVRAIVGTMIDVGRGKLSVDDMRYIIERKNRCAAGASAPAKGLWLVEVRY